MLISKEIIRQKITKQRNLLSPKEIITKSDNAKNIFIQFLPKLEKKNIAGYSSINNELNINAILQFYASSNIICLPYMIDHQQMAFKIWNSYDNLVPGLYRNILEPANSNEAVIPDIIIAPMLAADIHGNRIGYGKAIYDRYICNIRAKKEIIYIGIGYDWQIVEQITSSEFDQKLDFIVTDKRLIEIL